MEGIIEKVHDSSGKVNNRAKKYSRSAIYTRVGRGLERSDHNIMTMEIKEEKIDKTWIKGHTKAEKRRKIYRLKEDSINTYVPRRHNWMNGGRFIGLLLKTYQRSREHGNIFKES